MVRVTVEVDCCQPHHKELRIIPRLGVVREVEGNVLPTPGLVGFRKGELLMAFSLTSTQQVSLAVTVTDKKGNPAKVQDPSWLTDTPAVLALTPAADNMSCVVSAVGALGTAKVTFSADADMGTGVQQILGTLDVEVVAGTATVVSIQPGAPSEQP